MRLWGRKEVDVSQRHVSNREWKAWLEQNERNREQTAKKVRAIWTDNPSRSLWGAPARQGHRKAVAPDPDPMARVSRWPGQRMSGGK